MIATFATQRTLTAREKAVKNDPCATKTKGTRHASAIVACASVRECYSAPTSSLGGTLPIQCVVTRNQTAWAFWAAWLVFALWYFVWVSGNPCGPSPGESGRFALYLVTVPCLVAAGAALRWSHRVVLAVALCVALAGASLLVMLGIGLAFAMNSGCFV